MWSAARWKRFYAEERARLGKTGLAERLERAPVVELPLGGALVFPHTLLSATGHLTAAVARAVLRTGASEVLALGVLHGAREQDADLVRRARSGDAEARRALRRVHAAGDAVCAEEFSLDGFVALLELAAAHEGKKAPRVIARYPFLVGDDPLPPGVEEVVHLAQRIPVVATTDPIHHGAGYGTPHDARLEERDEAATAWAHACVDKQLSLLLRGAWGDFARLAAEVGSDFRDTGPVLAHALRGRGEMRFEILELRLVDYAEVLGAERPTWVAAPLVEVAITSARRSAHDDELAIVHGASVDETIAAPSAGTSAPETIAAVWPELTDVAGPQKLGGRYELLSLLGVGGMGAVYRARDVELDEIVALKMLRRELVEDPQSLARFRQEVKLARKVTHKHVARTYDIGEHGSDKFLTMEFVDGESLASLLAREGRLPLGRVVDLVEAVCAGLSAAHAVGIVHRDLKPDNVLVAKDGRVVITDFGIARAAVLEGEAAVHTMGTPIGTPAYMAPEQVEGSAHVDARTDIYALGAVLYELLTGERAWDGGSVYAVAVRRLTTPPPDPRARRPDLPDAAVRLIQRCMARKPEDRFSTTAEVASALADLTLPAPGATSPPLRSVVPPPLAGTEPGDKVVAVLPFRNLGAESDEYLADGLTDDLIDSLSMTRGLKVRARGVVMGYKGRDADPREVGGQLGVQVVVEGTVRRAGDRLRVNARVISVADGFQLWAQRFDRPAAEVFAVGDETARAVSQALTVDATLRQREAPTDPVAVDLYLRARHEYLKFWRAHVHAAKDLFEQALARAPDDPMILSGHAMALTRIFMFDPEADAAGDQAREFAERALRLAPHLGEPHVALASHKLNVGDSVGAAEAIRRALAVSPTLSEAHDLCGRLLVEAGDIEGGIARLRLALAGEPRLAICSYEIGRAYALLGQLDQSDAMFGAPPSEHGAAQLYWINRARIAVWYRQVDRAREWLADMRARDAVPYGAGSLLQILIGEPFSDDERVDVLARAGSPGRALRRRAFFSQIVTEISVLQRQMGEAFRWLEAADAAGLFDLSWLERSPILDALRGDPRYARVHAAVRERASRVREALGATARPAHASAAGS